MKDRIKLAFIGCGGITKIHLDHGLAKFDDVDFVGWCDPNEANSQARREQAGGKGEIFTDVGKMLDETQPDAVYIMLPPFAHGPTEQLVLDRNLPFFIEKPVAIDMKTASNILKHVKEKNLITSAGYMTRYRKGVAAVRKLLETQKPVLMHGGWLGAGPPETAPLYNWWVQKDKSGGQFTEQVSHTIDLARYLFGDVTEVYAVGVNDRKPRPDFFSIEDALMVQMKCANGAAINLYCSCCMSIKPEISLTVYGTDMKASFVEWAHDATIEQPDQETQKIVDEELIFSIEDRAFVDAIKTGDPSTILATYEDGYKALQISCAADESIRTGQVVKL